MNRPVITILLFTAFFSSCSNNNNNEVAEQNQSIDSSNVYSNASAVPAFTVKDMKSNGVNLRDIKGKKLFVNLWASWCPPCKREMPTIAELYKSVDTTKVAFMMISLDDMFERAKRYADSSKLPLPFYYPSGKIPALFNVESIPSTFIFNEKGEIIKRVDGSDDYNTDVYRSLLQ